MPFLSVKDETDEALKLLRLKGENEEGIQCTDYILASGFYELPHRTRVWWILTDRGKDAIEEVTGVKRLRERCRKCECWDEEKDQCIIERIGKRALTLEECREEGYWHWVEYEGWIPGNFVPLQQLLTPQTPRRESFDEGLPLVWLGFLDPKIPPTSLLYARM